MSCIYANINDNLLRLKVLSTPKQRKKGYQYCKYPPGKDEGLLFVLPYTGQHAFHMNNVPFNLEMICLDEAGEIRNIVPMIGESPKEKTNSRYYSHPDTAYVIEVRMGWCSDKEVLIGDSVLFTNKHGVP